MPTIDRDHLRAYRVTAIIIVHRPLERALRSLPVSAGGLERPDDRPRDRLPPPILLGIQKIVGLLTLGESGHLLAARPGNEPLGAERGPGHGLTAMLAAETVRLFVTGKGQEGSSDQNSGESAAGE